MVFQEETKAAGVNSRNGKAYSFNPLKVNMWRLEENIEKTKSKLEVIKKKNARWSEQANILFGYQGTGIKLEKEGMSEKAAASYEQAVAFGREADCMTVNQYFYSIKRLCIIYRKLHLYNKEIATINAALSEHLNDKDKERLSERLGKAQQLQAKQR